MKSFATKLRRFLVSEDGPTAVEYAVMLSLIICVCLAAITTIGTNASSVFSKAPTRSTKRLSGTRSARYRPRQPEGSAVAASSSASAAC